MTIFQNLRRFLFDFSASDKEHQELEQVLRTALSEAETDAEIETSIRRQFDHGDKQQAQMRWAMLGKLLAEYRHANEFSVSSRVLIERFLADMPKRYAHK
ncbi:MAG: hypothetical protein ACRYFS_12165 [Janthinobacterium lividum]